MSANIDTALDCAAGLQRLKTVAEGCGEVTEGCWGLWGAVQGCRGMEGYGGETTAVRTPIAPVIHRHRHHHCHGNFNGLCPCAQMHLEGNKRTACTACSNVCSVRVAILHIFCQIFRVAGTRWPKGFVYNN